MKAYLIIVTWPDGTEGLLFPRPGRVPVSDTVKAGEADFEKAKRDLISYAIDMWPPARKEQIEGTTIRLIEFERGATLKEFVISSEHYLVE